jgi:hypothetical protein
MNKSTEYALKASGWLLAETILGSAVVPICNAIKQLGQTRPILAGVLLGTFGTGCIVFTFISTAKLILNTNRSLCEMHDERKEAKKSL